MNTFQIPNGPLVSVVGNNILVERIAVDKVSKGGILIPGIEKEDATAIGIIRAVGQITTKEGGVAPIDSIVPGMKCFYLWFYAERHTNKSAQHRLTENFLFLKWEDIVLVCDADDQYEVTDIRSGN